MTSKIKNSQCGEVRSKKFFQNLKELIKTRLVMYFSTQTDEMPMRTTRITDLFNIQEGSKSPSGENQVDGLPPAPVNRWRYESEVQENMIPLSRGLGKSFSRIETCQKEF